MRGKRVREFHKMERQIAELKGDLQKIDSTNIVIHNNVFGLCEQLNEIKRKRVSYRLWQLITKRIPFLTKH